MSHTHTYLVPYDLKYESGICYRHGTVQSIIDFYFHFTVIQGDRTICTVFISGTIFIQYYNLEIICRSLQHKLCAQLHLIQILC